VSYILAFIVSRLPSIINRRIVTLLLISLSEISRLVLSLSIRLE